MSYPNALSSLINSFKKLPGIGEKSAERYALSIMELMGEDVENFASSMIDCRNNLHPCEICGHITDKDMCDICASDYRNKNVICILEDYKSVFAFEKAGNYNGVYHVLNGLISPIDGINPEDLNIASLINDRLDNVKEIILAINPSIEGEVTSLYIQKILEKKNIKISRLSYGIPMGGDIEYLDPLMISKALDDRKVIS